MSKKPKEISDNEIRIISASESKMRDVKRRKLGIWILIVFGSLFFGCLLYLYSHETESGGENDINGFAETATPIETPIVIDKNNSFANGFTIALDTVVNLRELLILKPENARPRLIIGSESLRDSSIVLATQAADVRGDNGQIAGTFVLNGELISKGEAKAGYCSIINGELSIGIADATPVLEQTLTEGGYFFRQYPLVVGGQIVENKPKGRAIRKALAEIGGKICVVISKEKLTFHDFSQLLIDVGARNAIYLVGSSSFGFYVKDDGEKVMIEKAPWKEVENVSYIIWEEV